MSGFSAIFRREMLSLWVTPLAWVLLGVFLLLQGGIFYSIIVHFSTFADLSVDDGPLGAYFGQNSVFLLMTLLLVCPALSMRLLAEERRSGTVESLMTAPVGAAGVVLGKYAAALVTYVLIWIPTVLYVVILRKTGNVAWPVVLSSYLGLFLVGAQYLAIGLLSSSLTKSQFVALLVTVLLQFGLFVLGIGEYIFDPGLLHDVCSYVSLAGHMEDFAKGIIDTRRLLYDASLAIFSPIFDDPHRRFVEARLNRAWLSRALPWLGAVAGALLLVNVNVLGARWYERWDVTPDRLYSLSQPTRELLHELGEPVDVNVLLSKSDPLLVSVRHMLEAYGAATQQLRVHYVDPDRSPAEFLAVQQKYRILAGKADDGRIVTDAALVIARGERHWFVTAEELVRFDEDSGRAQPALEQALSSALANLRSTEKTKLCFSTGHREPTLDDVGPQGLSELKQRLLKNNYEVESVDASAPHASFSSCVALLVATPELELGADDAKRIFDYVQSGGNALLLLAPTLGEDRTVHGSGLDPLLQLAGVTLGRDVVLEQDDTARLPSGSGELFFVKLRAHPVTRGVLHEDDKLSSRVLVVQARSLSVTGGATLLMESSTQALALQDLSGLSSPEARSGLEPRSLGLAAARELPKPPGSKSSHGPRLFISGASNLAWNRNFQDPSLYGNRRLLENAISWAAARPSMISVPEKPTREVGLSLSQESLSEVMRYVLLFMPGSAALVGVFVLLRRRNVERRSRSAASDRRDDGKS